MELFYGGTWNNLGKGELNFYSLIDSFYLDRLSLILTSEVVASFYICVLHFMFKLISYVNLMAPPELKIKKYASFAIY